MIHIDPAFNALLSQEKGINVKEYLYLFLLTKTGLNCCIPLMGWDPIDDHPVKNQGCFFLDKEQKFTYHLHTLLHL